MIYVNYRYPNLSDLIFTLFQVEANQEARTEIMRLMGVLGALDCFNLFKIPKDHNPLSGLSDQEILKVIETNHKSKFCFESKLISAEMILNWNFTEDPCENKLKGFFKNIINMNQILDKNIRDEALTQVIELNDLGLNKGDLKNRGKLVKNEIQLRDDDIRELLQLKDPINLSDIDSLLSYITNVTLKTLLTNLMDMTLTLNHKFIIDDLNTIVYTIGKEISPYLYILVPALCYYSKCCNNLLNHEILQLFQKILKDCSAKFGSESQKNVDLLIELILGNLNDPRCKEKCLDTLIELIDTSISSLIRQGFPQI